MGYDIRGNRGTESDVVMVTTLEDTSAPKINSISPRSARYTDSIPLSISVSDDIGIKSVRIQISRDGEQWEDVYTEEFGNRAVSRYVSYKLDTSNMAEGIYTVRVLGTDDAGNETNPDTTVYVEYYIDHTAPEAPVLSEGECSDGYINISWEKNKEEDLSCYNVYRKVNDGEYSLIAERI